MVFRRVDNLKKRPTPKRKSVDIDQEREKQLKESLEIINQLLDSPHWAHVEESIREIIQQRQDERAQTR